MKTEAASGPASPENTTRLRRFAIGLIKVRGLEVAQTLRKLNRSAVSSTSSK